MNYIRCCVRGFYLVLAAGCLLAVAPVARSQVLFDAGRGSLPEDQGWVYAYLMGTPTEMLVADSALLDTTSASAIEAGWSQVAGMDLNRTNGFTLTFTVQLNAETHSSPNRAGLSVIVLGDDKLGIELSFWTNTVFALGDNPLFYAAESANFATTGAFVNYALTIQATNYSLTANSLPILSGPIRNYTAFNGPVNPYETPNYLFFGDNTTSAAAAFNLRQVALLFAPTLATPAPGVVAWTGVSNQIYTVQGSTNLTAWNTLGAATSPNNAFSFTNSPVVRNQYFRVVLP